MANSKDPAFLFYPGDYLRDTQCLSEAVQVAYDRIMCEHMRNICISQKQLDFFTKRLTPDQKDELDMVLTKEGDCYQIAWVAESIEKRRAYSESRRKNRTSTPKKTSKTYDKHMENEIEIENKNDIDTVKVFYRSEYDSAEETPQKGMYMELVNHLIRDNELGKPSVWLKMENQLTFGQFQKLLTKAKSVDVLKDKADVAINKPSYLKGKKSVYLTLNNWI